MPKSMYDGKVRACAVQIKEFEIIDDQIVCKPKDKSIGVFHLPLAFYYSFNPITGWWFVQFLKGEEHDDVLTQVFMSDEDFKIMFSE